MKLIFCLSTILVSFYLVGCTRVPESPRKSVSETVTNKIVTVSPSEDLSDVKATQNKSDLCFNEFERIMRELDESAGFEPFVSVFQNFKHCMDASFAVGVNGHVTTQLLKKWDKLKELNQLFEKDKEFKKFFLSGISCAASSKTEIESVLQKVQKNCPKGLTRLCLDISKAAKRVLPCEEH